MCTDLVIFHTQVRSVGRHNVSGYNEPSEKMDELNKKGFLAGGGGSPAIVTTSPMHALIIWLRQTDAHAHSLSHTMQNEVHTHRHIH